MTIIDGPIKKEIQEAVKLYDSLPDWMKEKEHREKLTLDNFEELYEKHKDMIELIYKSMKKMSNSDRGLMTQLLPHDVLTLVIYRARKND